MPLGPKTRHLINSEAMAVMRPGAVLINTARGDLVETPALIEALQTGRLGAAALDVLDQEPPPADHPLRRMPNVILTPHAAFYSDTSLARLQRKVAEDVARVLTGQVPRNAVNRDEIARL